MKVQTGLWLIVLAGSVLANLAARRLQSSAPSSPASPATNTVALGGQGPKGHQPTTEKARPKPPPPQTRPAPPPNDPGKGLPNPAPAPSPLSGDVLVLVLQTDLLGEEDANLKTHLARFQDRNRTRLLGGTIYLLAASGPPHPLESDKGPGKGNAPFRDGDNGVLQRTFQRVSETLEEFRRRAGNRSFETLVLWKSRLEAAEEGALKDVRKPAGSVMVYWLTAGNPDSRGIDEWLGVPSVTCVDLTRSDETQLWVCMELYLKQKRKP